MNFLKSFRRLVKEQLTLWRIHEARISNIAPKPRRKSKQVKRRPQQSSEFSLSTDNLVTTWSNLIKAYFPDREDLLTYKVGWSRRRQKRTLASCNVRARRISVAREMSLPQCAEYMAPLLYHEMCHAVLGDKVARAGSKRMWHGPQFRSLESRHPGIRNLDLWIKQGGWSQAVRSYRAKEYHRKRREETSRLINHA